MKKYLNLGIVILFFTVFIKPVNSEEVKVDKNLIKVITSTDKSSVDVGDKIKYEIIVKTKKGVDVEFTSFDYKLGSFSIKDFISLESEFLGNKTLIQRYILSNFVSGEYVIPKIEIKYKKIDEKEWKIKETEEIKILVRSVLIEEENPQDIRDVKGPLNFSDKLKFWIFVIIVLIIIGLVILKIIFVKNKNKFKEKKIYQRPAYEIAYEALDNLQRKNYIMEGKIKEYYAELSLIVRCYLENRFDIKAPEMTTEEFLFKAKITEELSKGQKILLEEFLSCCDLVKFAKYGPVESEINGSFNSAKKFIDETKEILQLNNV